MVEMSVVRDVSTATSTTRPPSSAPLPRRTSVRRSGVSPSSSGDGVDILDATGQRRLAPALAAVARAESLADARDAVDLVGIGGVQRQRHHRRPRLHAVVQAAPRLAEIGAAIERAVLAAGGGAQAGVERARIVWGHADVA